MPIFRCLFWVLLCVAASARAQQVFPAGAPMKGPVSFVYAVYYPQPPALALAPLALLKQQRSPIKLVPAFAQQSAEPQAVASWLDHVQDSFTPPNLQHIGYFGRGLSTAQAQQLQLAQLALVVEFRWPATPGYAALRAADRLLLQVAEQTDGLIWDEETREIFTAAAWRQRRIDSWQGEIPNVAQHTVIHAYQGERLLRGITLGMAKFGLPDVVINDFPRSSSSQAGHLITALSQALVEGASIGARGQLALDLHQLRHAALRKTQLAELAEHAKGAALLYCEPGQHEPGDPDNRLLALRFDQYPGPDRYARQSALFSTVYGFSDGIQYIKHDDAILAASQAAKARLPALRSAFNAGLGTGEYILLKAPFATPAGGNEWMWVEVTAWDGQRITGLLNNEPANIPTLHSGQIVQVAMDDIFDYIRYDGQGNQEGNESGKLIARQQEGK